MDATLNTLKLFAAHNLLIESNLTRIEKQYAINLGKSDRRFEKKHFSYFEQRIIDDAAQMAKYYGVFYCLERSIRSLISSRLSEEHPGDWWQKCVPEIIRQNAEKNLKKELDSGVSIRSTLPIDYTTFGELGEIIKANWDLFRDILRSKTAVERIMANLNLLRGPIAHCSILAADEVDRLELTLKDWFRLFNPS